MNQIQRSFLAFLVAPLVPLLMLSTYVLGAEIFIQGVLLVGAYAYLITLLVAVPIYMLMLFKRWLKWWQFALLGVIPALSLDIWVFLNSWGSKSVLVSLSLGGVDIIVDGKRTLEGYIFLAKNLGFYSLTGVGAGLLFWYLAHGKNALTKVSRKGVTSDTI